MKNQILYSILLCSLTPVTWSTPTRISVNTQGVEGNSTSFLHSSAALSAEGRYVVFSSEASNLVPEDRNDTFDIFMYDVWLKHVTRVSVNAQGQEGNSASQTPVLSADGRYVAFSSFANNLVPNDTNQVADIFVHDLNTHQITRVTSKISQPSQEGYFHPSLSADGQYIAFDDAGNADDNTPSDVFVYHLETEEMKKISSPGHSSHPILSAHGGYVVFESIRENLSHIFIYDLHTQQTRLLTEAANGHSFAPSIAPEGQYVAFASESTNLVQNHDASVFDIFIQDLQSDKISSLHADDQSLFPVFSGSGRYLVFSSYATQLVSDDTNGTADLFRYELETQSIERINTDSQLLAPVSISATGCTLAFGSTATNLVSGDTNNSADVFVQQMVTQSPIFDFATTILDIPMVQIPGGGTYQAQLQLSPENTSNFVLNHVEPVSSSNKSCAYFSPESGLLYLPLVEANNAGQKTLYEVVMQMIVGSDPFQFELIRATPL